MARNTESLKIRPWAANGDRATPESAGLTRGRGWHRGYSLTGGPKPERRVFNQLLCEITSMLDEINTRGLPEWSAEVNYAHPAFVMGSNGVLYASLRDTGPGAGNAADPSGDTDIWKAY